MLRDHFCGLWRATVTANTDPAGHGRLQLNLSDLTGTSSTGWVRQCGPPVPTSLMAVPAVGSFVWVMFEKGDVNHPVWMGVQPYNEFVSVAEPGSGATTWADLVAP